jgi:hypothetical protein
MATESFMPQIREEETACWIEILNNKKEAHQMVNFFPGGVRGI